MSKLGHHNIYEPQPAAPQQVTEASPVPYQQQAGHRGLSDLQKYTSQLLARVQPWSFADSPLKVQRHKLDDENWQLTVMNPRTHKPILQAQGRGDTVLAHEEDLARMAETLMAQGLTIRTQFED